MSRRLLSVLLEVLPLMYWRWCGFPIVCCQSGQPVNTFVGTLNATDPDGAQTFTYSLASNPGGLFQLSGTGNRDLRSAAPIMFASYPTVTVGVTVSDGALTRTQSLLIVVVDVPTPPGVSAPPMSVAENSLVGALVGLVINNSPGEVLRFVAMTAGSTPAALTLFSIQECSGTVFVNQVRFWHRVLWVQS